MEKDFVLFDGAKVESQILENGARFVRLQLFIRRSPEAEPELLPTVAMPAAAAEQLCLRMLQCAGLVPNNSENVAGPVQ